MSINLQPVVSPETDKLLPILHEADEDDARIYATFVDGMHTSYAALDGKQLVGAATVRWEENESEIVYIAVVSDLRGHGYGKAIIALLLEEARLRSVCSLLVGTANTAFDNIAFYQKCGFRMDHVRRDYFQYIQPPIVQHGIPMCDMLVLRYVIDAG